MKTKKSLIASLLASACILSACSPLAFAPTTQSSLASATPTHLSPTAAPTPQPAELCPSTQKGIGFLKARFNPDLGLLNEAPQAAPHKYWLTNDNALAAYVLSQLGQSDLSATLRATLAHYGFEKNGQIEVIWGETGTFPPYTAQPTLVARVGENEIWQESHTIDAQMDDWEKYANLGFLGALDSYQRGNGERALEIFSGTLSLFDGTGFRDVAFNGRYETYKLALALYTGATIHAPLPDGDTLLRTLQAMQNDAGGFITHYRSLDVPDGDANTETTAFALLAEKTYGCGSR